MMLTKRVYGDEDNNGEDYSHDDSHDGKIVTKDWLLLPPVRMMVRMMMRMMVRMMVRMMQFNLCADQCDAHGATLLCRSGDHDG